MVMKLGKSMSTLQELHGVYSSKPSMGSPKLSAILIRPLALPNVGMAVFGLNGMS